MGDFHMVDRETPITRGYKDWRAVLPVHEAAERIPAYSDEELIKLGRLIKAAGRMHVRVIVQFDPVAGKHELLDGRSRLDAMVAVGIKFEIKTNPDGKVLIIADGCE